MTGVPPIPIPPPPGVGPGPRWCLAGAVVYAIGLVLPWARVELHLDPAGSFDPAAGVSVMHGFNLLTVAAFGPVLAAGILAAVSIRRTRRFRGGWIAVTITAVIASVVDLVSVLDPAGHVVEDLVRIGVPAPEAETAIERGSLSVHTIGLGGVVVVAGTVIVAVGAAVAIWKGPRRRVRDAGGAVPRTVPPRPA